MQSINPSRYIKEAVKSWRKIINIYSAHSMLLSFIVIEINSIFTVTYISLYIEKNLKKIPPQKGEDFQ